MVWVKISYFLTLGKYRSWGKNYFVKVRGPWLSCFVFRLGNNCGHALEYAECCNWKKEAVSGFSCWSPVFC